MPLNAKTPHSCGDSRLQCVDCAGQVCPQCALPCPVGNRCRTCGTRSGKSKTHSAATAFQPKKALGFGFFGGVFGYLIGLTTFGPMSCCFGIALWAAGRETGSQLRRGDRELAYTWLLPFAAGMLAGAALLVMTASAPDGLFMVAVNLGIIGLGMLMGGLGFG